MNQPLSPAEERLRQLLANVEVSAGFDARLMARVRAESEQATADAAARARLAESKRYAAAMRQLSWRSRVGRVLTLETLGVAILLLVGANALWGQVNASVPELLREHALAALVLLSLLAALLPLLPLLIVQLGGQWRQVAARL
jgi:hypothetical protein